MNEKVYCEECKWSDVFDCIHPSNTKLFHGLDFYRREPVVVVKKHDMCKIFNKDNNCPNFEEKVKGLDFYRNLQD